MDCDNGLDVLSNDGIFDIIPPSEYDPFEAKFCASLFWLVFHATEDGGLEDVPSQVTSPVQKHGKRGFVVHPEIVQFLTKGEVYCTVCSRVFPGKVSLAGHWSVIQTLSRNGIYVVDGGADVAVTDSSLEQTNPFNQGAHIALMDALMTAYSSQVVSIQSVVQAVRRFSTFSASRELPFDLEDALLLWINKLSTAVNAKHIKPASNSTKKLLRGREQERKVELRSENHEDTSSVALPAIDDLLKGLCDGRCLLGIILFYEPSVIKIEDICCPDVVSMEDSIRNLDHFRTLCSQYFCTSVLALKVEDILYGSPSLKINIVAMLAEMFSKCEQETRPGHEIQRSKTSCSENGPRELNGHDESTRSHSAPISRNKQFQERDISLKIQNFVENVGSPEKIVQSSRKQLPPKENGVELHSALSQASAEDLSENEGVVEVGGVVVKLRKKVPREVQPGGGHEALLSRRMKKSLCSRSQEDISNDTTPRTSDPEDQFDAKSDEIHEHNEPKPSEISAESEETELKSQVNGDVDNLGLTSVKDQPHSFELDLRFSPEAATPIDLLSPISETTEPGSLGNSLDGPMTSAGGLHALLGDTNFELRHQAGEKNKEIGDEVLTPPISRTPRKVNGEHQSSLEEYSVPRGSYVISNVSHTVESAVAAGIPIVERESLRNSGTFRGNTLSTKNGGNNGAISVRPSGSITALREEESENFEPTVHDQQNFVENHWSQRRTDNRFSTFKKDKKLDEKEDDHYSLNAIKTQTVKKDRSNLELVHEKENAKVGGEPTITWFVHRKDEVDHLEENVSKKPDPVSRETQRAILDSGVKKTSWAMVEDDRQNSKPVEKGSVECSRKNESVSRELNLLRLKLAEKQRDIEAQKQRTKEQLEEERKRFGQNVFWFAVGKGRERKEPFDIKPPKEKIIQKTIELPLPNVSKKALNSSEVESSKANRFETFTKRSPEEELPPSMAKLQDRTYNLKTTDGSLRKSNSDLASRPQSSPRKDENSVSFANHSVTGRNQSEEVVHEFRLSRQTSGSQDSILHKVQMTSKTPSPGNSIDSEKPRTPVMNYKSRISVPLTYTAKPTSENSSDMTDSRNAVEATSVNPSYDMAGPENVMRSASRNLSEMDDLRNVVDSTSVLAGVPDTGNPNQAPMPARKRWDTDLGSNEEPQLAVSKSNHHLLEEHRIDGTDDSYGNRRAISKNSMNPHWMEQTTSKNAGTGSVMASPDRISGNSDDQSEFTRQADLEKNAVVLKGSPEGQHETMEATNNSPVSDNGLDTPKKGLALFIGDQKTAGEDGLTPEQLRKKERFLRNRQQKMEEEKMKKEATLEKKRRKEEKMKEIQLRREQEEHSRQQRLQQKKEQAEIAKMERQKYEQHRKENLSRMNYVDGVPSGYHSLPRTEVNHQSFALVTNEGYPYGFMNGPTSAPSPSAFSGFTGVQSYVKPSGKTNRKLIINAISHVCLPGAVNKDTKDKCLQAMTESSAQHFLILFREGLKFRGLYSLDPESNQVLKVHGVGPRSVTEKMIDRLYKYNSGAKEFSVIPAKGFSLSVDGFTLQKSCWQSSNKPTIASKTVSNYKSSSYRTVR